MISRMDLRERFMKDPVERRLGSIASDLVRLANLAKIGNAGKEAFNNVLDEVKFFTEWSARDLHPEAQEKILNLQRVMVSWISSSSPERAMNIEHEARNWSKDILSVSGLL